MPDSAPLIESNSFIGAILRAESGRTISVTGGRGTVAASSAGAQFPTFDILAYNGGLLNLPALDLPCVFDLSSTEIASAGVPALYQHNHEKIVGSTSDVVIDRTANEIRAKAVANATGEFAELVRANAKQGYQWQVSVGLHSNNLERVETGSVSVNGQTFNAPLYVARANTLREISFVSVGADPGTFARLLATLKGSAMNFQEWLKSLGIDSAQWSEVEVAAAQRIYDAMQTAQSSASANPDETQRNEQVAAAARVAVTALRAHAATVSARLTASAGTGTGSTGTGATDAMAQFRAQQAAEFDRINAINAAAQSFGVAAAQVNGSSLVSMAISENWTIDRARTEFELANYRAQRPREVFAGAINTGAGGSLPGAAVLEAAVAQAGGMGRAQLEKHFRPEVLQAAHDRYRGRLSLQQMLLEAAYAHGYTGPMNVRGNLRGILQAAFSNISLPGIFSNTANKYLMEGFTTVDDSFRKLAAKRSVSDFKENSGYRGVGSFTMQELASDGRIRHGTTGEASYGNKVGTKAIMYSISRQDIYNDDLGALTAIPKGIGRGGILALIKAFWTEFLDNAAFFSVGNGNVSTGALGIAGLNAMLTKFRKLKDEASDYVMAKLKYLVVPVELEETAVQLYGSRMRGGGVTGDSDENPHYGKYEPVVSPYLSDSNFTGNSTTAYYGVADPNDIPVIEIAYLDGVEMPTVETADADFNTLGVQMRGYFDFGVRKQEYRGGVKSTGA